VLRSFGKFFGLAGVRLGFVLAERKLLKLLAEQVGPWAVSGPTRGGPGLPA
jgi:cobalamin biosynthetic protein CobC